MSRLGDFFSNLYDFVFPPLPVCHYCGARKQTARQPCKACANTWSKLTVMDKCGTHYACYAYDSVVKTAIRKYKYERQEHLAAHMADDLAKLIEDQNLAPDFISYIPLHPAKKRKRGFDQAEKTAKQVAENLGLTAQKTLKRVKRTKAQARLNPQTRKQNVKNAFKCDKATKKIKKSAIIILLDDVYTTGATMASAKEALQNAGYSNVIAVTFATSLVNLT